MRIKMKSLASALALGFALLFFGAATSTAQAQPLNRHGSFQGRAFAHRSFAPIRHRAFVRPFASRGFSANARPYRLVRVFVYDPFPRWVYRRVYYNAGAYCPY